MLLSVGNELTEDFYFTSWLHMVEMVVRRMISRAHLMLIPHINSGFWAIQKRIKVQYRGKLLLQHLNVASIWFILDLSSCFLVDRRWNRAWKPTKCFFLPNIISNWLHYVLSIRYAFHFLSYWLYREINIVFCHNTQQYTRFAINMRKRRGKRRSLKFKWCILMPKKNREENNLKERANFYVIFCYFWVGKKDSERTEKWDECHDNMA